MTIAPKPGPSPATTTPTLPRRRLSRPLLVAIAASLAGAACVVEQAAPPAASPAGSPAAGTQRLAPAEVRIVDMRTGADVPGGDRTATAGAVFTARLDTTLDSGSTAVGDAVGATLTSDLRSPAGDIVLPSGTVLAGQVTDVQPARKVHKMASMAFHFDKATLANGTTVAISAGESVDGRGWTGKQGAIIGGSAAGGAVLGQALGHDTQSTIAGAIVGGAIATGVIMSNKGEDVVVSSGSTMRLALDGDVTVKRPSAS